MSELNFADLVEPVAIDRKTADLNPVLGFNMPSRDHDLVLIR